MSDQNNAPELPARIWAWSEDDDFLRAKPHGVLHGTEYVRKDITRADRAAPEGQVRATIEGLIEDAIANAEVDYPAGREAGHSITWDSDRLLDDIIAALTLPPAAPTDNTALVDVLASLAAAISLLERGGKKAAPSDKMFEQMLIDYRASLERGRTAALASREAPPACQQEAVTESDLAAARAEIERLTKERDLSKELLRSCIQGNNVLRKKAQKAIAERDEARSMLADAERDMRQRAADSCLGLMTAQSARKFILALPLKHADREARAALAQGQKEGKDR